MVTVASFVHHTKIPHGDEKENSARHDAGDNTGGRMEGIRSLLVAEKKSTPR
jgi:hypothetical protein